MFDKTNDEPVIKRLVKQGGSTYLIVPPAILEMLGWKRRDTIALQVRGAELVVRKIDFTKVLGAKGENGGRSE